jgi:hypothetical protein
MATLSAAAALMVLDFINIVAGDAVVVDTVGGAVGREDIFECPEPKSAMRIHPSGVNVLVKPASISAGTVADLAEVSVEGIPESWPQVLDINSALRQAGG